MPKYTGVRKKGNRWYYRIKIGDSRPERGGFRTAEAAHRARLEEERRLKSQYINPQDLTVSELIVKYLEEHSKVYNRHSTTIQGESICRNHIIPVLGSRRIGSLTSNEMRKFQKDMVLQKTPAVAYNTMRTLRKILRWAVEWDMLSANPIRGKMPPKSEKEHPTITEHQIRKIFDNVTPREKIIISLGFFAGLRIGEIFGLQWDDIDFEKNTIHIRRQYSTGEIGPVKTTESAGVIPIWHQLARILKTWKLMSGGGEWMFRGEKPGKPLRPESWRQIHWGKIKKELDLPAELRFHDLRHSFATILFSKGAEQGDVQKLMRHRSIKITMDVYRHLLPTTLNRALNLFDDFCGEKGGESNLLSL